LLNDLEAVANAIPILQEADLCILQTGEIEKEGAIAVIAPGTGLGEGYLTWDGERYRAHPSEGGHVDFAPTNMEELELLRYLKTKIDHVSYERVCSGVGIPNIYAFFKDTGSFEEPDWLRDRLAEADDPTPIISRAASETDPTCDLCKKTMDTFVKILGSETGNLALKIMATGGVYLGGGIPPKILSRLMDGRFLDAFTRKGRFKPVLEKMNIAVILNPKAALYGAARFGIHQIALTMRGD
jgi:glucokinase